MRASLIAAMVAAAGAVATPTFAQGGRSSAIILELPASARALALGGAFTAVGGDDAAIFYNPAQLATRTAASAGLSVQRYVLESTLAAFSMAAHLGPGMFGIGVQALDYGSEPELVPDDNFGGQRGVPTGAEVSASDLVLVGGYGVRIGHFRIGAAGKMVRQRIADASGSTFAGDVGLAFDGWHGATIGVAVQHVGGEITLAGSSSPLPRTVRAGLAVPIHTVGSFSALVAADVVKAQETTAVFSAGTELTWHMSPTLTLVGRAGGALVPEDSDAQPLTFGGSVVAQHFALDYAYQGFETFFGATHRIGVRFWR